MLLALLGQTVAASNSLPCDSEPGLTQIASDSDAKNDSQAEECCDTDCCDADCVCISHACSTAMYIYPTYGETFRSLASNSLSTDRDETPNAIPSSLYRPPIFTS